MTTIPKMNGIPSLLNRSHINVLYPLFLSENFEDIPASRNIRGINHGLIKTTTDDIGFTAPRKM
jgi:hypothetical protein